MLTQNKPLKAQRSAPLTIVVWFLFLLLNSSCSSAASKNEKISTFSEAKLLLEEIHKEHPFTLYCGCKYENKQVDLKSCGYKVHKDAERAGRIEWEHVVPAHAFGQSFKEWREGSDKCVRKKKNKTKRYKGRKCASKNPLFARMEADLYNLYPEIGELNGLRSNFSMAAISKPYGPKAITFGNCLAVIEDRKFEPMDQAKGIVARIYMYMDEAYPGRGIISNKNRKLFEAWDKMFPVNEWECKRAEKIAGIQGNPNPVLITACAKKD
jgi:deoxyribonuclease I